MVNETKVATYDVREAGQVLGIGLGTTYKLINEGKIPVLKLGRKIRIPKVAIERMLSGETK